MHTSRRRSGHPLLAAVLTVSINSIAQAEPPERPDTTMPVKSGELELLQEEESVSIASRYEQPISQSPSNVYVITDEDIRQSGAIDLPTVLRRIPGIEVMQMTGADFNVSVRGDNQPFANKLLVLVDGRSIYVDVQGTVFWKAIPVTLPEIKRIEVLKGPASAVYGFNAFDGVINIITKSPAEMRGTTVQVGGGELGTLAASAIHAGTVNKFGYRLSIGRDQTQQWRNHDALAFRSNKFNVQTEYAVGRDGKLSVSGGLVDVNRFDGQLGEIVSPSAQPSLGYANAGYQTGTFFIQAWWSQFSDTALTTTNPLLGDLVTVTNRDGTSHNTFLGNTYNITGQHTIDWAPNNRLTYGINYRHNSLSSNAIQSFTREDRLGLYFQDEWSLHRVVTLVAGGRYDLQTFIHPTVSPRLALLYTPVDGHTFRAGLSIAYRPPTIFEVSAEQRTTITLPGLPPPLNTSVIPLTGSRGLRPEQIVSYEIGYQGWYLKHRLRARADLFFNHITDLITPRDVTPTSATFVNDSGQADIYGGEAGVELLATSWLTGFINYAYEEIGQSFSGTARRGAPRSKVNAGVRMEFDSGLSAEALFHHVDSAVYPVAATFTELAPFGVPAVSTRVGSYNLLNMRAGYRFWQQKAAAGYMRDAEVAVSVFNALNDQHKEHPLGDIISRRVMGWITVKF